MNRAQVTTYLRIAGYHEDRAAYTRLLVENRISKRAADEAYRSGRQAMQAGVRCTCAPCQVPMSDRLFIGCYPAGIVYADKARERGGDYLRVAFLSFKRLVIDWDKETCPPAMRATIEAHALTLQNRRGESYEVSTCGQTIRFGE